MEIKTIEFFWKNIWEKVINCKRLAVPFDVCVMNDLENEMQKWMWGRRGDPSSGNKTIIINEWPLSFIIIYTIPCRSHLHQILLKMVEVNVEAESKLIVRN